MDRATSGTTIGRPLPAVVLVSGTVAASDLLVDPEVDALAVPVAPAAAGEDDLQPRTGTADAAARYGIALADLAERAGLTGAAGETSTVHLPQPVGGTGSGTGFPWSGLSPRLVLVGVGGGSADEMRRAGAALASATRGLRRVVTSVASEGGPQAPRALRAFVEGYLLAAYRTPTRSTRSPEPARQRPASELVLLGRHGTRAAQAVEDAVRAAGATWLVRDLANTPSSTKNPAWLADQAVRLAERAGLTVTVRGPQELAAAGFGGILAVGAGSASPPRLVTVEYTPAGEAPSLGWRHVVVVGKGITYDTGGLSIKAREAMVPMKTDMAGAAVALATVLGAADAGIGHRVTAVLPLAENHVGGASYRPGDVLRMYGGRTVEIANTDAEGRIVLADALAWADAELDPDILIDVATLTGAASIGLGRQHAALYTSDPRLVGPFETAAGESGEPVWHMPLVEEYADAVRSDVADLRHVPLDKKTGGGSITAALFLREFVGARRWVHLDIAGPARAQADKHEITAGATGFGARLLLRYLAALR